MIRLLPVFITLMRWRSPGLGGLPAWRERVEDGERVISERGGRLLSVYVTLGRYDVVEIFEAPDDQAAAAITGTISMRADVTTETLRAFTREEAEEIVRNL